MSDKPSLLNLDLELLGKKAAEMTFMTRLFNDR